MTGSRLISTCHVATGADTVVITVGATTFSASISSGDYYHRDDGSADDLCVVLQTAISVNAAAAGVGPNWLVYIHRCDVRGIGSYASTSYAPGRIVIEHDSAFSLRRTSGSWTLPHRVLGQISTSDQNSVNPSGSVHVCLSPHVHRYGWYPQDVAMQDLTRRVVDVHAQYSSDRRLSRVCWSDEDGHLTIGLEYDQIHRALVRIDACTSAAAAEMGLTAGDPNCGFERWGMDCSTSLDCDRAWYYYPDQEQTTGVSGPYVWPADSPLWQDPLGMSIVRDPAGERWAISLAGTERIT